MIRRSAREPEEKRMKQEVDDQDWNDRPRQFD